ncbi:MAG: type transport system permease protein [Acidobacteriota bacterium]|jgi:ABC-type transport system involved in multi-copper enzyme maturation permease subunit|nr:type transport system permease protein [Acidobacteriota bacterium]
MTRAIFRRELLDAIVSRKLLWICILCFVPIPLSTLVNQRALAQFAAYHTRAQADYEQSLVGMKPADQVEVRAFRAKPPLSCLAFGLESVLPNTVSLRRDGASIGQGAGQENPILSLFGRIDLLFIVRFVLSLAAIVLTFGAVCTEKETGTLSLIFSSPVPRDSFLFGKYLAALLILIGPFAASMLLTAVLLQLQGAASLTSTESLLQLLGIFLFCSLYLMTFLGLGILVSASTFRSLTAITVLLFLWAGLVAVLPQSAGLLAERLVPVESAESFLLQKNLLSQDFERRRAAELEPLSEDPNYSQLRQPIAMKYAVELAKATAERDQEHAYRQRTQFRVATILASVSPVTPLTLGVSTLAGTGVPQSEQFLGALSRYQAEVNEKIFSNGYRDVFPGGRASFQINMIDLRSAPHFAPVRLSLSQMVRSTMGSLIVLILANAALFVAAYFRFYRYEVS